MYGIAGAIHKCRGAYNDDCGAIVVGGNACDVGVEFFLMAKILMDVVAREEAFCKEDACVVACGGIALAGIAESDNHQCSVHKSSLVILVCVAFSNSSCEMAV